MGIEGICIEKAYIINYFWRREIVLTNSSYEQNVSGGLMFLLRQKSTALSISHFYIIKYQASATLKEVT